jgi:uncharacterized protein involved in outer membrane biogenesis
LAGKVHLEKILLQGTDVGIARDQDGKVNIYNIVASGASEQPPPPPAEPTQKKPFDLMIDEIVVKNARVSVSDAYKAGSGAAAAPVDFLRLPRVVGERHSA